MSRSTGFLIEESALPSQMSLPLAITGRRLVHPLALCDYPPGLHIRQIPLPRWLIPSPDSIRLGCAISILPRLLRRHVLQPFTKNSHLTCMLAQ